MSLKIVGRRLALAATVAVLAGSAARANHSWGGYHWPMTSSPVVIRFDDNLTAVWKSHLAEALTDWDKSDKLTLSVETGSANPKTCKAVTGRVQVCNAAYGNNGWLGIAQIWLSGSHITKGAVKLNDTYYKTSTYNTPAWRDFVMCQEVGHIFGLDHQDEGFALPNLGTCMDYTGDPSVAPANLQPNAHDYAQLDLIYTPHGDVASTSATRSPFAVTGNPEAGGGDTPGEWGRAVAFTADGRGRVFARELAGGGKVITFVTWTVERSAGH
jgi:hypothetical protein